MKKTYRIMVITDGRTTYDYIRAGSHTEANDLGKARYPHSIVAVMADPYEAVKIK